MWVVPAGLAEAASCLLLAVILWRLAGPGRPVPGAAAPAGLGAAGVAVPVLLRRTGVPLATALGGVLVYRALSTLLPAVAGAAALVRLRPGTAGKGASRPGRRPGR